MPHLYVDGSFLLSPLPLQNLRPHGYQPMHSSNKQEQDAHKFDVSAHFGVDTDLVALSGAKDTRVVDVKLWTESINIDSEVPKNIMRIKNNRQSNEIILKSMKGITRLFTWPLYPFL